MKIRKFFGKLRKTKDKEPNNTPMTQDQAEQFFRAILNIPKPKDLL